MICADHRRAACIQLALLRYGQMVEVASTFRRGLAVIQHRPPTAIVIDQALPGLDQDQLTRVLAAKPETAELAVVMLPAHELAMPQIGERGSGQVSVHPEVVGADIAAALGRTYAL